MSKKEQLFKIRDEVWLYLAHDSIVVAIWQCIDMIYCNAGLHDFDTKIGHLWIVIILLHIFFAVANYLNQVNSKHTQMYWNWGIKSMWLCQNHDK